ncbi:unnamed protein product [Tilletia caries]|nr:unnamed protein product [Tilletia caries]
MGRQLVRRNDDRDDVDPFTLPNRDDTSYARALHDLSAARNAHERTKLQKETGHYLHHIGDTAAQLGSIRVASQARCEREIGYIKRSVRSTKAPIPNIVNNVLRTGCLRLLDILVGEEESEEKKLRGILKVKIGAQHRKLTDYEDHQQSLLLVMTQEAGHFPTPLPQLVFRGRLVLNDGTVLRGDRIEQKATRRGSRFLLRTEKEITYHEVIHFMTYSDDGNALDDKAIIGLDLVLALIWTICDVTKASGIIRGRWSSQLDMIQFGPDDMVEPVAIVELDKYVYILRSHTWTGID